MLHVTAVLGALATAALKVCGSPTGTFTGLGVTVTVVFVVTASAAVVLLPDSVSVTVIVTGPGVVPVGATPVTTPLAFTVASAVLAEPHVSLLGAVRTILPARSFA